MNNVQNILETVHARLEEFGKPPERDSSFLVGWIKGMDGHLIQDRHRAIKVLEETVVDVSGGDTDTIFNYERTDDAWGLCWLLRRAIERVTETIKPPEVAASVAKPSFMEWSLKGMNNVEQLVGSYLMECFVNRVEPDFGGEAQRLSVIERILKDREELEEEIETYESVIDGVVGHRVID
jgi:hypothetical protein